MATRWQQEPQLPGELSGRAPPGLEGPDFCPRERLSKLVSVFWGVGQFPPLDPSPFTVLTSVVITKVPWGKDVT